MIYSKFISARSYIIAGLLYMLLATEEMKSRDIIMKYKVDFKRMAMMPPVVFYVLFLHLNGGLYRTT